MITTDSGPASLMSHSILTHTPPHFLTEPGRSIAPFPSQAGLVKRENKMRGRQAATLKKKTETVWRARLRSQYHFQQYKGSQLGSHSGRKKKEESIPLRASMIWGGHDSVLRTVCRIEGKGSFLQDCRQEDLGGRRRSKCPVNHAQNGKSRHKADTDHRRETFPSVIFNICLPPLTWVSCLKYPHVETQPR